MMEQKEENEQRKKEYKNGETERRKRSEIQVWIVDGAEEEKCVANARITSRIANKRTNFMMEQKEENEQKKKRSRTEKPREEKEVKHKHELLMEQKRKSASRVHE